MRSSYIMFLAPALACLAISGCGGSGPKGDCDCPANRTIVTVKFAGTPTAVATQIGSGSFTAATLSSGSVTLSVPAGTTNFAVAYVCQGASTLGNIQTNYTYQYVFESSTADGTSLSETCAFAGIAGGTGNSGTLTGSVDASAIPGANYVGVEADNGSSGEEDFIASDSEQFSESLPAGTDRVAVEGYVYTAGQNGSNAVFTLAAVRNFDGVSVPGAVNSGNTVTLGAADQVTTQPITYNNAPGGFSTPTTVAWYEWNGGGGILLSNGATNQYPVAPAGAAESGDFYDLISTTSMSASSGVFEAETIETNTASGSPLAVNFPAPWSYSGPTPSAQPTFDMANSSITGTTGVTESGELEWFVPSVESTSVDIWSVSATGNYLNGSTSLAFPNLGGLTGFVSGPASGDTANWFAFISKSSAASGQSVIPSGTITSVETSGSFTVP